MSEHPLQAATGSRLRRWIIGLLLLLIGAGMGFMVAQSGPHFQAEKIEFSRHGIPTLMVHPLGGQGAYRNHIGNWELLSSLTAGNDSLVLKYNGTYIAAITAATDHTIESMVINHPLHNRILLILERLNEAGTTGKLTTDILSADGKKTGFVIDENMDGQPDLRFEYAGPYLYVWLEQYWHRVLRTSPREAGGGFKHTVTYQQQMHEIDLQTFPYELKPIDNASPQE